jgi:hypothetical protein
MYMNMFMFLYCLLVHFLITSKCAWHVYVYPVLVHVHVHVQGDMHEYSMYMFMYFVLFYFRVHVRVQVNFHLHVPILDYVHIHTHVQVHVAWTVTWAWHGHGHRHRDGRLMVNDVIQNLTSSFSVTEFFFARVAFHSAASLIKCINILMNYSRSIIQHILFYSSYGSTSKFYHVYYVKAAR